MGFDERLREIRTKSGLTQKELADKSGVSVVTIQNCESGSAANSKTLIKIARVLGVSIDYLLLGEENISVVSESKSPYVTTPKSDNCNKSHDAVELVLLEAFRQLGIEMKEFTPIQLNVFKNQINSELKHIIWNLKDAIIAFRK